MVFNIMKKVKYNELKLLKGTKPTPKQLRALSGFENADRVVYDTNGETVYVEFNGVIYEI
jgi:hypothetical protein